MLQSVEAARRVDGRIEGAIGDAEGWAPYSPDPQHTRQTRFMLGDPESGPLVWLFEGNPVERPDGKDHTAPYPHLHRTATFRVALGDQPRQLYLNNAWYGPGEYFLLDANKVYTDPHGLDGYRQLLIFGDRRGMHPAAKDTAGMSAEDLVAWNTRMFGSFEGGLPTVHPHNDEATFGASITTHETLGHGAQARGSFSDPSDWAVLSDGSRVAGVFMGDRLAGPAVVMTVNAPGAVEPPGVSGADMFRLIARGSCTIGGRVCTAGSFVACEAGAGLKEVVHGPDGCTQLLVTSDRRHWAPEDGRGVRARSSRLDEIDGVLGGHLARQGR